MAWTPLAVAPLGGPKYCVEFQPRLGAGLDRAAHRIGALGEFAEPDEFFGDADDRDLAVGEDEIVFRTFERLAGELQRFLPHGARGFVDRIAGDNRAAARKRAGAPIEPIGVAGDDIDVGDIDAELVGDDLRKAREMPLPLGADPGGDTDLAVGLHLDLGAFVGPDAGAFDVAGDADADVAALRASFGCSSLEEIGIADRFERLVEHRLVIAAVVVERLKILVDDLVLVWKRVRTE